MAISKSKREAVYRKYKGHCAYCGREIAYKDMQVDHFQPLRAWGIEDAGTDDLDNLMPACRMCNHYKRANSLETFRRYIAEIPRKLRENYIYKVGVVYGNVIEAEKPIEFYFEAQERKVEDNGWTHRAHGRTRACLERRCEGNREHKALSRRCLHQRCVLGGLTGNPVLAGCQSVAGSK